MAHDPADPILDKAVRGLFERVPEFARYRQTSNNTVSYEVFGDLALALSGRSETVGLSEEAKQQAFEFLNELSGTTNSRLRDLLLTGVLEVLADTEDGLRLARIHLNKTGLALLDEVLR